VGKEAKRMKKHFFFQKRREGKGDGEFILAFASSIHNKQTTKFIDS
jgi:hypothetical protein